MKTTWSFQKVILHIGPTFSMQTNQRQGRGNQMKKLRICQIGWTGDGTGAK